MPPPSRLNDILIYRVQHLTQFKNSDIGAKTIERVANIMKPLLREHNWRVGMLSEFLPKDGGLLGLNCNAGATIHIRMRHHSDPNQFMPFEQIMDTALHEMCHNTFGPHDESFHKMWDQMRDEYWHLMQTGFTGNYFTGRGHYVGGKVTKTEARRIARAEAAKNAPKGLEPINRKLGGAPPPRIRSRGEMADKIVQAAEKRMGRICGSGRKSPEQRQLVADAAKNARVIEIDDDENEAAIQQAFMELAQQEREREAKAKYGGSGRSRDEAMIIPESSPAKAFDPGSRAYDAPKAPIWDTMVEDDPRWECKACTMLNQPTSNICEACETPATRIDPSLQAKQKQALDDAKRWECKVCTKLNPPTSLICRACDSPATAAAASEGKKVKQEQALKQAKQWSCVFCTMLNEPSSLACAACEIAKDGGAPEGSGYKPSGHHPTYGGAAYNANPQPFISGGSSSKMKVIPKPRVLGVQTEIPIREAPKTWKCHYCTREMDSQWWTCDTCGEVKARS